MYASSACSDYTALLRQLVSALAARRSEHDLGQLSNLSARVLKNARLTQYDLVPRL